MLPTAYAFGILYLVSFALLAWLMKREEKR